MFVVLVTHRNSGQTSATNHPAGRGMMWGCRENGGRGVGGGLGFAEVIAIKGGRQV